jgi:uncharacterized membrane protein
MEVLQLISTDWLTSMRSIFFSFLFLYYCETKEKKMLYYCITKEKMLRMEILQLINTSWLTVELPYLVFSFLFLYNSITVSVGDPTALSHLLYGSDPWGPEDDSGDSKHVALLM